jgi:hypothetical protein
MGNVARLLIIALAALASLATSTDEGAPPDAAGGDGSSGDGGAGVVYDAAGMAMALDRIVIVKADPGPDICAAVRLVCPGEGMSFGITAPEGWAVEFAYVTRGAAGCSASQAFPADTVMATGGSGSVTWTVQEQGAYPDKLSIDATLAFSQKPEWVPATVEMRATDLSIRW